MRTRRALVGAILAGALGCSRDEGPCGGCYGGVPHPRTHGGFASQDRIASVDLERLDGTRVMGERRESLGMAYDEDGISFSFGADELGVYGTFPRAAAGDAGAADAANDGDASDRDDASDAAAPDDASDAGDAGAEAGDGRRDELRPVARITWTPPGGDEPMGPTPMVFEVVLCPDRDQWLERLEDDVCRRASGAIGPPERLTYQGTYERQTLEDTGSGDLWVARLATPRVRVTASKVQAYEPRTVDPNCY